LLDYFISQRLGEIGLRMALGATRGNVVGLVALRAAKPAIAGVAIGSVLAVLSLRIVRSVLVEISATDPLALLAAPAGVLVVIAVASAIPAFRAGRLTPAVALRKG